jgi:hypothetical protein
MTRERTCLFDMLTKSYRLKELRPECLTAIKGQNEMQKIQ